MGAGRIRHKIPVGDLLPVELLIGVMDGSGDGIMIRRVGLDDDLPRLVAPSGTACRLTQQLKGPLSAPEVLSEQRQIRRQNSHQRHVGVVVSFDDHLGSQQHVGVSPGKGL